MLKSVLRLNFNPPTTNLSSPASSNDETHPTPPPPHCVRCPRHPPHFPYQPAIRNNSAAPSCSRCDRSYAAAALLMHSGRVVPVTQQQQFYIKLVRALRFALLLCRCDAVYCRCCSSRCTALAESTCIDCLIWNVRYPPPSLLGF